MACHLETERLLLRPPEAEDVRSIVNLVGDYDVAKNLSRVPHPYSEDDARGWVTRANGEARAKGTDFPFAITRKAERLVAGWFHDNPASWHVLEKVGFVAGGADQRDCFVRGHAVYCNKVVLERENFGRRKAAV